MKTKLGAIAAAFTLAFSAAAIAQGDVAAASAASDAPRTKAVLACILGMGLDGCNASFRAGALPVFQHVAWRGGANPYFQGARYVERNSADDDVWNVKIRGATYTYIIAPPDQDGAIVRLFVMTGPQNRLCENQIEQAVEHNGRIWISCNALFSSATH